MMESQIRATIHGHKCKTIKKFLKLCHENRNKSKDEDVDTLEKGWHMINEMFQCHRTLYHLGEPLHENKLKMH